MLAKVRGWQCQWPVAMWSMRLCLRKDLEQVLESHKPGGSFSLAKPAHLTPPSSPQREGATCMRSSACPSAATVIIFMQQNSGRELVPHNSLCRFKGGECVHVG